MPNDPTGERFIPEAMGGQLIEAEHVARYALAAQVAKGLRVLDAGCGVGWGTGLLLAAGAASATGLDIDQEAVNDAKSRVPGAEFVKGDLSSLPWPDSSFDLVVCFEALEHVAEQEKTLDELARVLARDGVLFVSSPNPRVYPKGNPFHLHEFVPEELLSAVESRFTNVQLWAQHSQVVSALIPTGSFTTTERENVVGSAVSPLEAGSDPYCLAVASWRALPKLLPVFCCAPSEQLVHLEAFAALLDNQKQLMDEDQKRVVAEREILLAEVESLRNDSLTSEKARALIAERDRLSALLLESEQQLAFARSAEPAPLEADHDIVEENLKVALTEIEHHVDALNSTVIELESQIAELRGSTSWRVTAPLRLVSRGLSALRT